MLAAWEHDATWMKKQPGYISTQLHRGISHLAFHVPELAVWKSVEHFRAAFTNPEFRGALAAYPSSVVASPHLFEKVGGAEFVYELSGRVIPRRRTKRWRARISIATSLRRLGACSLPRRRSDYRIPGSSSSLRPRE